MAVNITNSQLTKSQAEVFNSILEDIFYLKKSLHTTKSENLIHLTRISIIFNYISLETLRNFYCEKLSIKKDKATGNYQWESFFTYKDHTKKINHLLQERQYTDFKNIKAVKDFINELRLYRNLILHRSKSLNKKHNQKKILKYLKNIKKPDVEKNFIKSKNCIEIMNYIMELN